MIIEIFSVNASTIIVHWINIIIPDGTPPLDATPLVFIHSVNIFIIIMQALLTTIMVIAVVVAIVFNIVYRNRKWVPPTSITHIILLVCIPLHNLQKIYNIIECEYVYIYLFAYNS